MRRTTVVAAVLLTCLSTHVFAGDTSSGLHKAEILAKAQKLFGEPYSPPAAKPLRLYDEQTETGPPDGNIYWHGASYVVELVFARDGELARVQLFPEALLHSDNWNDVPVGVELSRAKMKWLVESASALRPMGKQIQLSDAPDGCFQSGRNLYCSDTYEQAVVTHYEFETADREHVTKIALGQITIAYRQSISAVVEAVRMIGAERQLKVCGNWYYGGEPPEDSGIDMFATATVGSTVKLIAFGCAANEKSCMAIPDETGLKTSK